MKIILSYAKRLFSCLYIKLCEHVNTNRELKKEHAGFSFSTQNTTDHFILALIRLFFLSSQMLEKDPLNVFLIVAEVSNLVSDHLSFRTFENCQIYVPDTQILLLSALSFRKP